MTSRKHGGDMRCVAGSHITLNNLGSTLITLFNPLQFVLSVNPPSPLHLVHPRPLVHLIVRPLEFPFERCDSSFFGREGGREVGEETTNTVYSEEDVGWCRGRDGGG